MLPYSSLLFQPVLPLYIIDGIVSAVVFFAPPSPTPSFFFLFRVVQSRANTHINGPPNHFLQNCSLPFFSLYLHPSVIEGYFFILLSRSVVVVHLPTFFFFFYFTKLLARFMCSVRFKIPRPAPLTFVEEQ